MTGKWQTRAGAPTRPVGATPGELALSVLRRMADAGLELVCVNGYEDLPAKVASDVDVVVAEKDVAQARRVAVETAAAYGYWLATALWYDLPDCWALVFMDDESRYLQLDLESDTTGIGRLGRARAACLAGARAGALGLPTAAPEARAGYIVRKREYKALTGPDALTSYREALGLLGRPAPPEDSPPTSRGLRRRHRTTRAAEFLRPGFPRGRWLEGNLRRATWRLRHSTGSVVCFVGPDGAGKSTTQAHAADVVRQSLQKQRFVHVRPHRLDVLVRGRRRPSPSPQGAPPDRDQQKTTGAALLKLAAMWLDAQTLRADFFTARRRKTLVGWERGLLDLLLDPERHGLERVPEILRRLAVSTSPRPDAVVACVADPVVAHGRKPELPLDVVSRQMDLTRHLATGRGYALVHTDRPVEPALLASVCLPTPAATAALRRWGL